MWSKGVGMPVNGWPPEAGEGTGCRNRDGGAKRHTGRDNMGTGDMLGDHTGQCGAVDALSIGENEID